MRRQSVADSLRESERSRVASLTAAERVRLALELGRRSLESYCATSGLAPERHVRATGVKKGHLIEQALRHHLQALQELPADVIVHPKLVVTRKSGAALLKEIEKAKPTEALRDLLRDGD
jgi:hypothetical protein